MSVCFITTLLWEPVRGLLLSVEVWQWGFGLFSWTCCNLLCVMVIFCICVVCPSVRECKLPALVLLVKLTWCMQRAWSGYDKRCYRNAGYLPIQHVFLGYIICMLCAWSVLIPMAAVASEVRWWVPSQGQWNWILPDTWWLTNFGLVICKLVAGLCISSIIVLYYGFH